jgi:hypothetical protein
VNFGAVPKAENVVNVIAKGWLKWGKHPSPPIYYSMSYVKGRRSCLPHATPVLGGQEEFWDSPGGVQSRFPLPFLVTSPYSRPVATRTVAIGDIRGSASNQPQAHLRGMS